MADFCPLPKYTLKYVKGCIVNVDTGQSVPSGDQTNLGAPTGAQTLCIGDPEWTRLSNGVGYRFNAMRSDSGKFKLYLYIF